MAMIAVSEGVYSRLEKVEPVNQNSPSTESHQPRLLPNAKSTKETFRYVRNFLAGRFVGATRDETFLEEVVKCLFCKLYIETSNVEPDVGDASEPESLAQFYRGIFGQVRSDYPEIYEANEEISLDPESLQEVIRSLGFPLLDAKSDPIGDAFEVFAGSESKARSGQFFTPRNATDLLVGMVDPQPWESIIDPACGAGGFLASVTRHFRLQGLPVHDAANAADCLYGIEKDGYLAKLGRVHVSLLSGGHPRVVCGDSLAFTTEEGTDLAELVPAGGYNVVLTNPPFGVNIVAASPEVLKGFDLARRWRISDGRLQPTTEVRPKVPPQVLFVERCLSLLREGGRLGMVMPESMLSNKSYRYVVEFLRSKGSIVAVVGMPESLFKTSGKGGTHTKTCLMVFTKGDDQEPASRIFMAEAHWCGKDSRAREIPHDELPEIGQRFMDFQLGRPVEAGPLGFQVEESAIDGNVFCPRYYDPEIDAGLSRLSRTHQLLRFGSLVAEGCLSVRTGDEVGKLAYGMGEIPFVRTSDLSNWEIKLDPKHRLDRKLYESLKAGQDVQPNDILMVKDGTYLIGTCGIVTDYDLEIVYQSHLYKIRTHENSYGLNPFLLLAVLNSDIVKRQIRAKQFTQDIIDSLGERINELVLPVPQAPEQIQRITDMVSHVVQERVEARELARRAVVEVLQ